jgi:hypothetical protein
VIRSSRCGPGGLTAARHGDVGLDRSAAVPDERLLLASTGAAARGVEVRRALRCALAWKSIRPVALLPFPPKQVRRGTQARSGGRLVLVRSAEKISGDAGYRSPRQSARRSFLPFARSEPAAAAAGMLVPRSMQEPRARGGGRAGLLRSDTPNAEYAWRPEVAGETRRQILALGRRRRRAAPAVAVTWRSEWRP